MAVKNQSVYDSSKNAFRIIQNENTEQSFQIAKADDDKRLVFGWALVSATSDGEQIIDHQGDIVDQDELEEGAYEYVLNFRDAGEEHIGSLRKKARMVESVVFTEEKLQAMGIPLGTVPYGWWIGFYVDDDTTWERIKNGTYNMFSIEGKAVREPVDGLVTKALAKGQEKKLVDRWTQDKNPFKILKKGEETHTAKSFVDVLKFNPYHDARGRFSSSGGAKSFSAWRTNLVDYDKKKEAFESRTNAATRNSDNPSIATSNKIKQEFVDAGLNSKFAGVRRNAQEGKGAYSYKDAVPVSESDALKMSNMQFVEHNGKTLVHGLTDNKNVFYANNSDSKEIKSLRQENERRNQKKLEETKHRPETLTTTSTYDRWKSNHDKNFAAWFGKSERVAKTFSELIEKFNPYHDARGRFTSGSGGGYASFSANPNTKAGKLAIERASAQHPLVGAAFGSDSSASTKPKEPSSGGIKAIEIESPNGTKLSYRVNSKGVITDITGGKPKNTNGMTLDQLHERAKEKGYKVKTYDDNQLKDYDTQRAKEKADWKKFVTENDVKDRSNTYKAPRKGWKGH